jgi:site-specific recombinase XerD
MGKKAHNTAKNKKAPMPGSVFSLPEIESILAGCSRRGLSGIRNRALLAIMFGAGLRVSEAINLFKSDIDLHERTLLVRNGKGSKSRRVGIYAPMLPYVETWVAKREAALGLNGKSPLFCTHTQGDERNLSGKPISAAYVRGFLKRLESKLGLEKRLHSHAFRHSLANFMVSNQVPLNGIQAQLGHATPAITSAYIAKISPQTLVKIMDNLPGNPPKQQ